MSAPTLAAHPGLDQPHWGQAARGSLGPPPSPVRTAIPPTADHRPRGHHSDPGLSLLTALPCEGTSGAFFSLFLTGHVNGVQSNKLRLFPGASRQDTAQTCTSDLSPARDPRIRSVERGPLLPAGRSPAVKVSSYLFKNKSAVFTIRPVPSLFFIRKSSRQRLSMAGWVWWTRRHMQTVCPQSHASWRSQHRSVRPPEEKRDKC